MRVRVFLARAHYVRTVGPRATPAITLLPSSHRHKQQAVCMSNLDMLYILMDQKIDFYFLKIFQDIECNIFYYKYFILPAMLSLVCIS